MLSLESAMEPEHGRTWSPIPLLTTALASSHSSHDLWLQKNRTRSTPNQIQPMRQHV